MKIGPAPLLDLAHEIKIQNAVRDLIREGLVKSAHDCSEGGLAVALAECCFNQEKLFGADVRVTHASGSPGDESAVADLRGEEDRKRDACATLFNESQSRIIISVVPGDLEKTLAILREHAVPFKQLGNVGTDELCIRVDEEVFRWPIASLYDDWFHAIRRAVEEEESIPSL